MGPRAFPRLAAASLALGSLGGCGSGPADPLVDVDAVPSEVVTACEAYFSAVIACMSQADLDAIGYQTEREACDEDPWGFGVPGGFGTPEDYWCVVDALAGRSCLTTAEVQAAWEADAACRYWET